MSSARGQLPKVYLRLDPQIDSHPDWEAMVLLMVWANRQPRRGYYKSEEFLRRLLGAKRFAAAVQRNDLRKLRDGSYHLEGWEEWQEGDLTVGERVARLRAKRSGRKPAVDEPLHQRRPPSKAKGVGRRALGEGDVRTKKTPGAAGGAANNGGGGTPPPASASGSGWVPYDHGNPAEVRLVARCEELAAQVAALEEREPTDADRLEVLRAVSTTPGTNGKPPKSITELRGAPPAWVEESLRACEAFEQDLKPPADEPAEE